MPQVGDVMILKSDESLKACRTVTARVQVLEHPGALKVGYMPVASVRTGRAPVRLSAIDWKIGKETKGEKQLTPPRLVCNEMAQCVFTPQQPLVVDTFKACAGLGRVAIMDGNLCVMLGTVVKWEFAEDDEEEEGPAAAAEDKR